MSGNKRDCALNFSSVPPKGSFPRMAICESILIQKSKRVGGESGSKIPIRLRWKNARTAIPTSLLFCIDKGKTATPVRLIFDRLRGSPIRPSDRA